MYVISLTETRAHYSNTVTREAAAAVYIVTS